MKLTEAQLRRIIKEELESGSASEKLNQALALVKEALGMVRKGSTGYMYVDAVIGHPNTAIDGVSEPSRDRR